MRDRLVLRKEASFFYFFALKFIKNLPQREAALCKPLKKNEKNFGLTLKTFRRAPLPATTAV
jgi:hypothetical protein